MVARRHDEITLADLEMIQVELVAAVRTFGLHPPDRDLLVQLVRAWTKQQRWQLMTPKQRTVDAKGMVARA